MLIHVVTCTPAWCASELTPAPACSPAPHGRCPPLPLHDEPQPQNPRTAQLRAAAGLHGRGRPCASAPQVCSPSPDESKGTPGSARANPAQDTPGMMKRLFQGLPSPGGALRSAVKRLGGRHSVGRTQGRPARGGRTRDDEDAWRSAVGGSPGGAFRADPNLVPGRAGRNRVHPRPSISTESREYRAWDEQGWAAIQQAVRRHNIAGRSNMTKHERIVVLIQNGIGP